MAEHDESLEAPPSYDALVFGTVSALSERVVERGAGWETDTRLELDNPTACPASCR
jgi:hypothetical protein